MNQIIERNNKNILFEQNKTLRRTIYGIAVAGVLGIGAYFGIPAIVDAYQKHEANNLIIETDNKEKDLEISIEKTRKSLEDNRFILTGSDELDSLVLKISESEGALNFVKKGFEDAKNDFSNENYKSVRIRLDESYGLENEQRRETPKTVALKAKVESDWVFNYLDTKRTLRDNVVDNEYTLTARTMKPIKEELAEALLGAEIPSKYYGLIGKDDGSLVDKLKTSLTSDIVDSEKLLNNSLGTNLLAHRNRVEHIIEFCENDNIKSKAKNYFQNATDSYTSVVPSLSNTKRYNQTNDDGKLTTDEYRKLLSSQQKILEDITNGNNNLTELDRYFKELHDQEFVYVSDNGSHLKTFHHSRTKFRTVTHHSGSGKTRRTWTSSEPYSESYTTTGRSYYCVLTNVSPNGSSSNEEYVGQRDSFIESWDYNTQQTKGWVREWKKLHEDCSMIHSGWKNNLNPIIEPLNDKCEIILKEINNLK